MRRLICWCGKGYDADKALLEGHVGWCSKECLGERKEILRKKEVRRERIRKRELERLRAKSSGKKLVAQVKKKRGRARGERFLRTLEWRRLRYAVLRKFGHACMSCGARAPEVQIHVDHIKPRSRFPELALDINNLQVLCEVCNLGKGARFVDDLRPNAKF